VVHIREAAKRDLDAIVLLWKQLMQFHTDLDPVFRLNPAAEKIFRKFITKCVRSRSVLTLVAEEDEKIVAFCNTTVEMNPPVFHPGRFGMISDLVVDAGYRRRGIGTRLVETVKLWLLKQGIRSVRLRAATVNPVAVSFWRSRGFKDIIVTLSQEITTSGAPEGE